MPATACLRATSRTAALVLALAAAMGCAGSPEERVAELRSKYEVMQFSFLVPDKPAAVPQVVDLSEAGDVEATEIDPEPADRVTADVTAVAEEPAAGGAVDGGEEGAAMVAPEESGREVLFDVLLFFRGRNSLPGLTLDITHADAAEVEKGVYRHYVDTSDMVKGDAAQIAFTLEGLPFEEGDVFSVAVRERVPIEERGDYREFSEAGS